MNQNILNSIDVLNNIRESLFKHCKASSLKDNELELNAVLSKYNEMFNQVIYELEESNTYSDTIWNIRRGASIEVNKKEFDAIIKLNGIFQKCISLNEHNKLTVRDTPNQEELEFLLKAGFKEGK